MAKLKRVTFELPPAPYVILEQAAEENGINVQAAASLILQAALARRISGLVPKRPVKAGLGGTGTPATADAAADAADLGSNAAANAPASSGFSEDTGTR
ncbi:MAG: hypothetical protein OXP66_15785 [Candidatus Tectomicrobia bacterium]|nr:hypothetical protein [Candidatus Tectomicrobia bacterium]